MYKFAVPFCDIGAWTHAEQAKEIPNPTNAYVQSQTIAGLEKHPKSQVVIVEGELEVVQGHSGREVRGVADRTVGRVADPVEGGEAADDATTRLQRCTNLHHKPFGLDICLQVADRNRCELLPYNAVAYDVPHYGVEKVVSRNSRF